MIKSRKHGFVSFKLSQSNRSYKNSKAVEEEGERFREAVVAVVVLFSCSRVVHVVRRRHIV